MAKSFLALVFLLFAAPALAQSPIYSVPAPSSAGSLDLPKTITGTSAAIITAGVYTNAKFLNQASGDIIYCRWGATAVAGPAAGQYTFSGPNSGWIWDGSDPPPRNQALNCISSGSSTPATARAY